MTVSRSNFVKGMSGVALGVALGTGRLPSALAAEHEEPGNSSPEGGMPGNASEGGEAAIPVPSAEFIERVNSLGGHLYFENDSAKLGLDLADSDLQTNYGFNDSDVRQLRKIIEETARADESVLSQETVPVDDSGNRFYISNFDLMSGTFAILATAAASSPEALAAAWVGVSSMIGGPVGTIIAGGVSLLGLGFFADLALKITGAIAQGKGIALYTKWGFPPLRAEIE